MNDQKPQPNLIQTEAADDGVISYKEPTIEMLDTSPWSRVLEPNKVDAWRKTIEESMSPFLEHLKIIVQKKWTGEDFLTEPDENDQQKLIDGLLRIELLTGEIPQEQDRIDLAKRLGVWLAFANANPNERYRQSLGAGNMYDILDKFIVDVGRVAALKNPLPEWAEQLQAMTKPDQDEEDEPDESWRTWEKTEIDETKPEPSNMHLPWADIHDTLLVFLNSFYDHTETLKEAPWETDGAIQGNLVLRLLAGTTPNLVSDEMVEKLTWLDSHLCPGLLGPDETMLLRQRIEATWNRLLLERVTVTASKEEETTKDPTPVRRRFV